MSSPRLEDDVAYYGSTICDDCGSRHDDDSSCYYDDPDEAWENMMDK